jgi:hypothetical protein
MTLRMVLEPGKGDHVLALHGWLSGPEVSEFERVATHASLPLRIDLSHLAGADQSGVTALNSQRERGARLTNASPYIGLLLKAPEPPEDRPALRKRRGSAPDG